MALTDQEIVPRAQRGDQAAWHELVTRHQAGVFRLAYLKLGDPQEAEDIAQETFVRAYRHLDRFDQSKPLRPWLLGICSNLAKNRLRSMGRYWRALLRWARETPEAVDRQRLASNRQEPGAAGRQARRLWELVGALKPQDQEVIHLRFFMDLSVAETAQLLGLPGGTVKSRQHRALERLRGLLAVEAPELLPEDGDE